MASHTLLAMSRHSDLDYYQREKLGAPLSDQMTFRVQKRLAVFIRTVALTEGRDPAQLICRMLHEACQEIGYDPDGY